MNGEDSLRAGDDVSWNWALFLVWSEIGFWTLPDPVCLSYGAALVSEAPVGDIPAFISSIDETSDQCPRAHLSPAVFHVFVGARGWPGGFYSAFSCQGIDCCDILVSANL